MISTTADYALRAVVFLADHDNGFTTRSEISRATRVPHDYLLKVLNELDDAGIVESRRGPGGGYRLTLRSDQITVLQIVLTVDDIPRITECPLGISKHQRLCRLHRLLDRASQLVEQAFRDVTIAELVTGRKRSRSCDFPIANTK